MSSQIVPRGKSDPRQIPLPKNSKSLQISQAPQKSNTGPQLLTFLVSIEHVEPNHVVQEPQRDSFGFFRPPSRHNAYKRHDPGLFRWCDGALTGITSNDPGWRHDLACHSQATIFSQKERTDHLLAVDLDATTVDLPYGNHRWGTLAFEHIPVSNHTAKPTYSKITVAGLEDEIAAPGSSDIVNQILPTCYDYTKQLDQQQQEIQPDKVSAGLIGNLPILISLAAFSAPPNRLGQVLERHVRLHQWIPHNLPPGRRPQRGMIVKVYYDPANPERSTPQLLNALRDGHFGAFYTG